MIHFKLAPITFIVAILTLTFYYNAIAAQNKIVTLDVPGMTCKFCPITIRKALEKVPGVIDVKAEYETKSATVAFDPSKTSVEKLTNATKNAGYPSTLKQK